MKANALCVFLLAAAVVVAAEAAVKTDFLKRQITEIQLPEARIIDGEAAAENSAPYMVSLSVSPLIYAHHCGGSIIARNWVLTAAHCVQELQKLNGDIIGLPVYAGLHDRSSIAGAQISRIDFAFSHKQFNGLEGSEDIALLHVTPPFKFSAQVQQIALPVQNEDFSNITTVAYGWGLTKPTDNAYVQQLQMGKGQLLSYKDCGNHLPQDAPLGAKQICAAVQACYGDGGSPLIVQHAPGVAELVGIISWGYIPCGFEKRPTAFTAVSQYINWITEVQWAYNILH